MKLHEQNPLPGLKIYDHFIPDNLHDNFVKQMQFGIAEANVGHYDGYTFPEDFAFDAAFLPRIEYTFAKIDVIIAMRYYFLRWVQCIKRKFSTTRFLNNT